MFTTLKNWNANIYFVAFITGCSHILASWSTLKSLISYRLTLWLISLPDSNWKVRFLFVCLWVCFYFSCMVIVNNFFSWFWSDCFLLNMSQKLHKAWTEVAGMNKICILIVYIDANFVLGLVCSPVWWMFTFLFVFWVFRTFIFEWMRERWLGWNWLSGISRNGVQMAIKLSYHRFIYSTVAAIFDSYLITV